MLLSAAKSCLVIIDMQERLIPAIHNGDAAVARAGLLATAATRLEVPLIVTRQYPKGLGDTVETLRGLYSEDCNFDKTYFASTGESGFKQRLDALAREQVVVVGTEAHVCVLQTVLGLRADGKSVFVVADAVGSRTAENRELGLARMRDAGAQIVSTEMVVFEWLEKAGTPEFKELSALIK